LGDLGIESPELVTRRRDITPKWRFLTSADGELSDPLA
jgi:hypothetical protein